jgi:hypothetical protein
VREIKFGNNGRGRKFQFFLFVVLCCCLCVFLRVGKSFELWKISFEKSFFAELLTIVYDGSCVGGFQRIFALL